ncbi:MAG: precorrin-6A/cobalt-precorrin-6A reductase, partial [Pseudobutyrivibrio sp.]|nr:precorrin-6A/cobalt-precorrin-6A reductase [Pseudobutyrivibrio sp.]
MKKVIIFGGTTEGRKLAEILEKEQVTVVYCVATEYGKQQLEPSAFIRVRTGRMDWHEMSSFFGEEKPDAIVDATHPFAQLVKSELENAIFDYGAVPFFRVTRAEEDVDFSNCRFFESTEECAKALINTTGKIFLTTGSKELKVFCENEPLRERL